MLLQSFALHIFHAAEHSSIGERPGIVHRDDSRMFEARQYFSFAQKARSEIFFPLDEIENFQSNLPMQDLVFREPNRCHTAACQQSHGPVARTAQIGRCDI